VLADVDDISVLLDGRIGDDFLDAIFGRAGLAESVPAIGVYVSDDMDFVI
jgi:hypothetical protein